MTNPREELERLVEELDNAMDDVLENAIRYGVEELSYDVTSGLKDAKERYAAARQRLLDFAGREGTCKWDHDEDSWETSCGGCWTFIDGGPKENRMAFCHKCGKPIELPVTPTEEVPHE